MTYSVTAAEQSLASNFPSPFEASASIGLAMSLLALLEALSYCANGILFAMWAVMLHCFSANNFQIVKV